MRNCGLSFRCGGIVGLVITGVMLVMCFFMVRKAWAGVFLPESSWVLYVEEPGVYEAMAAGSIVWGGISSKIPVARLQKVLDRLVRGSSRLVLGGTLVLVWVGHKVVRVVWAHGEDELKHLPQAEDLKDPLFPSKPPRPSLVFPLDDLFEDSQEEDPIAEELERQFWDRVKELEGDGESSDGAEYSN